jgi:hypothetical protein
LTADGPAVEPHLLGANQAVTEAEDADNVYSLDLAIEIGCRWYNYVPPSN